MSLKLKNLVKTCLILLIIQGYGCASTKDQGIDDSLDGVDSRKLEFCLKEIGNFHPEIQGNIVGYELPENSKRELTASEKGEIEHWILQHRKAIISTDAMKSFIACAKLENLSK